MRKILITSKEYLSVFSTVAYALLLISLPIYFIARVSPAFADFINNTVGHALRILLGTAHRIFPFSLFEVLVIFALPIFFLLIWLAFKIGKDKKSRIKFIISFTAAISLIATSYIYTLGVGYHVSPLAEKLSLENKQNIEKEELVHTFITVLDEVNKHAQLVRYENGKSKPDMTYDEISKKLSASYKALSEEYSFMKTYKTRAKPVMASSFMSDAGITGIYSFFTGEPNVNVEYPPFTFPFTAAHEFAHARGISRENEANFMAFLACISSGDAYLRYSGYLNMYQYLSSAVYSLDKDLYIELSAGLDKNALADLQAASAVSKEHSNSVIGKINDKLNDFYLKSNGTEGVVSYGYVVRLAVSYFNQK